MLSMARTMKYSAQGWNPDAFHLDELSAMVICAARGPETAFESTSERARTDRAGRLLEPDFLPSTAESETPLRELDAFPICPQPDYLG
jgi:hypothetical protein